MHVYKYKLSLEEDVALELPRGALVALVAVQGRDVAPSIWFVEHGDAVEREPRRFRVVGTGQPLPGSSIHRGSCFYGDGALVWHVFEIL